MNWLWAYLRKKAMESILAGVHDALTSGDSQTGLTDEQAARAVRVIVGVPSPADHPGTAPSGIGPTPQFPAPEPDGSAALSEARRGPGRPRKFQEPPQ